jgi:hypothetical protein
MAMEFIRETEKREGVRYGLYLCSFCGSETEKRIANVASGRTRSCGCQAKMKKKGSTGNQEGPFDPIDSGTYREPLPVPSFERVTISGFRRVAEYPFWVTYVGKTAIDRQPMSFKERNQFRSKNQERIGNDKHENLSS